jgi:hypothetical protein
LKSSLNIPLPFLPIHTDAEHKIFVSCMRENSSISEMLKEFAKKSNGIDIFPKLQSHLEKHMKTWKEFGKNNLLRVQVDKGIKALRSELLLNIANHDNFTNEELDSVMDNNSDVELDIVSSDDEQMRSSSLSFVNGSLSVDREAIDSQPNSHIVESHPANESSNIDSSNDVLSNDCEESDGVVQDTESNNPASLPIADSPEISMWT